MGKTCKFFEGKIVLLASIIVFIHPVLSQPVACEELPDDTAIQKPLLIATTWKNTHNRFPSDNKSNSKKLTNFQAGHNVTRSKPIFFSVQKTTRKINDQYELAIAAFAEQIGTFMAKLAPNLSNIFLKNQVDKTAYVKQKAINAKSVTNNNSLINNAKVQPKKLPDSSANYEKKIVDELFVLMPEKLTVLRPRTAKKHWQETNSISLRKANQEQDERQLAVAQQQLIQNTFNGINTKPLFNANSPPPSRQATLWESPSLHSSHSKVESYNGAQLAQQKSITTQEYTNSPSSFRRVTLWESPSSRSSHSKVESYNGAQLAQQKSITTQAYTNSSVPSRSDTHPTIWEDPLLINHPFLAHSGSKKVLLRRDSSQDNPIFIVRLASSEGVKKDLVQKNNTSIPLQSTAELVNKQLPKQKDVTIQAPVNPSPMLIRIPPVETNARHSTLPLLHATVELVNKQLPQRKDVIPQAPVNPLPILIRIPPVETNASHSTLPLPHATVELVNKQLPQRKDVIPQAPVNPLPILIRIPPVETNAPHSTLPLPHATVELVNKQLPKQKDVTTQSSVNPSPILIRIPPVETNVPRSTLPLPHATVELINKQLPKQKDITTQAAPHSSNQMLSNRFVESGVFNYLAPVLDNDKNKLIPASVRTISKNNNASSIKSASIKPLAEDAVTKRMRYLLAYGTSTLQPGECFMFSEETGEGILFSSTGATEKRMLAPPQEHNKVVAARRPDIVNPEVMQYSLSILGKLLPNTNTGNNSYTQPITGPNLDDLMKQTQKGFLGWLNKVFK